MPPSWMWPFDEELEPWFLEVERKRKDRTGGGSNDEPFDESSAAQNELAMGLR